MPTEELIRCRLVAFLEEDLGGGDITSEAVVPADRRSAAAVVAREAGVMAGVREARVLAGLCGLTCTIGIDDGAPFAVGDQVLRLEGASRAILGVERTLLNVISHMTGVATATAATVAALYGTGARVAATRKTLPGLRWLEKRAVRLGGGDPHRYDLSSAVLIKDNHLAITGDVAAAVRSAREHASFTATVEIEVESIEDALAAAEAGADILMLDNMAPEEVVEAIAALRRAGLREQVRIEASGGIRPDNARAWADAGVDVVSIGALTASAPSFDFTLVMEPDPNGSESPE